MSRKQRERAVENWEKKNIAIEEASRVRALDAVGDHAQSDSDDEVSLASVVSRNPAPAMPVLTGNEASQGHREKLEDDPVAHLAMVTRPVGQGELARIPAALQAVEDEWNKLRALKAWIE